MEYPITGYVRNLPDGSVEMVAEGDPREIDGFVADLKSRMRGCVRHMHQQTAAADGRYPDFSVRS